MQQRCNISIKMRRLSIKKRQWFFSVVCLTGSYFTNGTKVTENQTLLVQLEDAFVDPIAL